MSISVYIGAFALSAMPIAVAAQAISSSSAANADAAVMPYEYKSAFENYQAMKDDGDASASIWRAANDAVGRVGGHAGYMRSGHDAAARTMDKDGSAAKRPSAAPYSEHGSHPH